MFSCCFACCNDREPETIEERPKGTSEECSELVRDGRRPSTNTATSKSTTKAGSDSSVKQIEDGNTETALADGRRSTIPLNDEEDTTLNELTSLRGPIDIAPTRLMRSVESIGDVPSKVYDLPMTQTDDMVMLQYSTTAPGMMSAELSIDQAAVFNESMKSMTLQKTDSTLPGGGKLRHPNRGSIKMFD